MSRQKIAILVMKTNIYPTILVGNANEISSRKEQLWRKRGRQYRGVGANCGLHPLIHTFKEFVLTQDIESIKKAKPKTPHFLSLNQDIVAMPQKAKCELKYVIHTSTNMVRGSK